MQSTVSVIIPAFNAARYIAETVSSALQQTHSAVDVIVVDDGSTDSTRDILSDLQRRDSRVHVIHQPNTGQGAARNAALSLAEGEFVAFLDADDLWAKDKIELQLRAADLADVVFTSTDHFTEDPSVDCPEHLFCSYHGFYSPEVFFQQLYERNDIALSSVLARREIVENVGGFDADVNLKGCEDWDLWLRLARAGATFYGMPEKLVRYRSHVAQTSANRQRMVLATLFLTEAHAVAYRSRSVPGAKIFGLRRELIRLAIDRNDFAGARHEIARLAKSDISHLRKLLYTVWSAAGYLKGWCRAHSQNAGKRL